MNYVLKICHDISEFLDNERDKILFSICENQERFDSKENLVKTFK